MNNSVLEKTMEYVTKNRDIKLVRSEARRNQLQNLTIIQFFLKKYISMRNEKKPHTNIHK